MAAEDEDYPNDCSDSMPACRWLSCVYKGGVLGVAAYDTITNEASCTNSS